MRFINSELGAPESFLRTFGPNDPPTFEGATGCYEIPSDQDRYWRIAGHVTCACWLGSDIRIWTSDFSLGSHLKSIVSDYTNQNENPGGYTRGFDDRGPHHDDVYYERLTNERRFPSVRLTVAPQFGVPRVRGVLAGFQFQGRGFLILEPEAPLSASIRDAETIALNADQVGRVQFACGFIEEIQQRTYAPTDLQAITQSHDFEHSVNTAILCTRRKSNPFVSWVHDFPDSMLRPM